MGQVLELEIKYLFSRSKNPPEVAEDLLSRWNTGKLSSEQQIEVSLFLINSNLITQLLEQFSKLLVERQKIPWACFNEALSLSGTTLRRDDIDQILLGAAEENALGELVMSKALDSVDPRFAKIRKDIFPPVARSGKSSSSVLELKNKLFDFEKRNSLQENPREQERLKSHFLSLADENPENAYDISVSMHMMGFSQEALDVLKRAPMTESKHWLELELLMDTEKYLEVLSKCDWLENANAESVDAISTVLYTRARAYRGLGQNKVALETLQKLRKFNPEFALANTLQLEWRDD